MATEQGLILQNRPSGMALVRTMKTAECEGCSSKGSCEGKGNDMEVEAINEVDAKPGDTVVLAYATSSLLKATFLLYVFPIICMIIGAVIGQKYAPDMSMGESAASAIVGFTFFFVAVFVVKISGNKMAEKAKYTPKITRVIRHDPDFIQE
ncbi:MAG: SoxR reducing system RseC family protein [Desulfobacterales bacterium]|nr:SoxR reducing system RseC family protein [Desulfobacterales bacterium]